MKKIINEYIIKAEALSLSCPNNNLVKRYLLSLNSLINLSDVRLIGLSEAIPWVYEVLESEQDSSRSWEVFNAFSVMVNKAKKPSPVDRLI